MENENVYNETMVGRKENVIGGIRYYGETSSNGQYYKDLNAIEMRKGICYIAEASFAHDTNEGEDFLLLTPDNTYKLIDMGGVETYESAFNQVRDYVLGKFPEYKHVNNIDTAWDFIYKITNYILDELDGQCLGTFLDQMDLYEEMKYFLEDEFVKFAKNRIIEDNDDTDISDDNTLRKDLLAFLGDECYMDNDYLPTDWDSLLDKWENEPNY